MTQPEESVAKAFSLHLSSPDEFPHEFLQKVVDALPESLAVIDRDYNVVLANRAARLESRVFDVSSARIKCYSCFHHRTSPCVSTSDPFEAEHGACPLRRVIQSKAPTRVYHTHHDSEQREISVAVDVAPVFDENGEVVLIIETCRDVTERCLSRRLCRIGNRHMKMAPLLEEYSIDIARFARCANVHIHVFSEPCAVCDNSDTPNTLGSDRSQRLPDSALETTICVRQLRRDFGSLLPPETSFGSILFERFSTFLSRLPDTTRRHLAACTSPECESAALIPIRLTETDLGLLHVTDPHPNAITEEMVESLERLSLDLGAAIHRVRIEEALQAARSQLEARVRERTEELTKSNRALQTEIAERARLEREVLHTGVREQMRIGQELHDGVGQELTGMGYLAQNLLMSIEDRTSPAFEMATELAHSIPKVLGHIQNIVRGLIPLEIGAADIERALELLTINTEKQTNIACQFHAFGSNLIEDDDIPIQIYRIAQEAIANAVKHAGAQTIDVEFRTTGESIKLEVSDNGSGIQTGAENGSGSGLRSMRYRARAIGGEITIRQRPNGGTAVTCKIRRAT